MFVNYFTVVKTLPPPQNKLQLDLALFLSKKIILELNLLGFVIVEAP